MSPCVTVFSPPSLPFCSCHLLISSQSSDSPKPKDPPWLALVKSDSKKKLAPPPPPIGVATPPQAGPSRRSVKEEESHLAASVKEEGSRPATPPNPFDDDDGGEEAETAELTVPSSVAAVHPWYGISQTAEVTGANTPPSRGSPAPSGSPASGRSKKRLAPKAPKSSPTGQSVILTRKSIFY